MHCQRCDSITIGLFQLGIPECEWVPNSPNPAVETTIHTPAQLSGLVCRQGAEEISRTPDDSVGCIGRQLSENDALGATFLAVLLTFHNRNRMVFV